VQDLFAELVADGRSAHARPADGPAATQLAWKWWYYHRSGEPLDQQVGVVVQILHRTDVTRHACADANALLRAFGAAWEMVARLLTVLFNSANLAEVAKMACIQLRQVAGATCGVVQFVVRHDSAEISFEGIRAEATAVETDEQNVLQRIRAIVVDSITVTAPVPA